MTDLPVIMTKQGAIPTPPATLRATLLALVSATNPGYTANLPGSLIEDISSTDVGALTLQDSARVDTINSLTPYATNDFLTNQLGQVYGVPQGGPSNTSVFVVFHSTTSPGFAIPIGFIITDGTHQYVIQDGGIIGSDGNTAPLFAIANVQGSWSVAANTVTALVTSAPGGINLTVNNPTAGTPGDPDGESAADYRVRVLEAGLVACQSMPSLLRTLLGNISGVQTRLISIRPASVSGFWEILCGGGDPYQVAYAIFTAIFDITSLMGSVSNPARNITVSVIDYPDSYPITFVNPVEQKTTVVLTWSTDSPNAVSQAAIAQLGGAALSAYINSIPVGQPLNLYEMQAVFLASISSVLPTDFVTNLQFLISLDGTPVSPNPGTSIISGDPEGYFTTDLSSIIILQG